VRTALIIVGESLTWVTVCAETAAAVTLIEFWTTDKPKAAWVVMILGFVFVYLTTFIQLTKQASSSYSTSSWSKAMEKLSLCLRV
jgi:amino acid permease